MSPQEALGKLFGVFPEQSVDPDVQKIRKDALAVLNELARDYYRYGEFHGYDQGYIDAVGKRAKYL